MSVLYHSLYPLATALSLAAVPFSKKLREGYRGRFGLLGRIRTYKARFPQSPIWFHVASSGEFEQCLPVMEHCRSLLKRPIFLSYFSPSAKKAIALEKERRHRANLSIPWTYEDYVSLDFRALARKYIEVLSPKLFVSIHREIWPAIIEELERKEIPKLLIAAAFPPGTRKSLRFYSRWLECFNYVGTTDNESTTFLRTYFPELKIDTVGDPRMERVHLRSLWQMNAVWEPFFRQPIFLGGSIWPQDFTQLQATLTHLSKRSPKWRVILAPHQPHRKFLLQLERWFKERSLPIRRWSHWLQSPDEQSHLIVDTIGILAELYRVAHVVFVGGSFKKRVHNVLEPAAYGKPILTGPLITNSREAVYLSNNQGLISSNGAHSLCENIQRLIDRPEYYREQSQFLTRFIHSAKGVSKAYAMLIEEHIHAN